MRTLRSVFLASSFIASTVIIGPVPASAQFATGIVTEVVLNDLQGKADHVIQSAQDAGDFLIWRAAQQALAVIEAWKKANSELINQAFDRLDATQRQLFIEIDRSLDRMDQERELAVADAQRLTLQWAQTIKSLPLTNKDAELLTYSPRVVLPPGEQLIDVQIFGPKLANSSLTMTGDKGNVPVQFSTETTGRAQLNRKDFKFASDESSRAIYKVTFVQSSGLFNQKTVDRQLPIWLAPVHLGEYKITSKVNTDRLETKEVYLTVGARGKDNAEHRGVPLPPDLTSSGWEIDIAKLVNPRAGWIHDLGGDHGHCSGVDRNSITKTGFTFVMDIGHTTGSFGKKGDGFQNCGLDVPIVHHIHEVKDGPVLTDKIGWSDLRVELPTDLASKTIEVTLFNGRSHLITDPGTSPLGLLSVQDSGTYVVFRPKPPADF